MEKLTKVKCTECEGKFYLEDFLLPCGIEPGEAFPSNCPFCEEGDHAVFMGKAKKPKGA